MGLTLLKAYSLSLKAKIERERIRAGDHGTDEILEELQTLTTQVASAFGTGGLHRETGGGSGQKPAAPAESPGP